MTRRTLGGLWARYFEVRGSLERDTMSSVQRRATEREARQLRDRLVVNYSPLVKHVAGRVVSRLIAPIELEDVLSWGVFGLLEAVETFDPGRRTKFESYAISKIRWAILDELRRLDPLTRRVRRRAREVEAARAGLAQRLGRTPAEDEVACELGVGIEEHRAFLAGLLRAQVGSLEAALDPSGGVGGDLHQLLADGRAPSPESAAVQAEVRARLTQAIETLGDKERIVTTFYYFEGLTLKEIGGALSLTEGRISQILHKSLRKLRGALAESLERT